MPLQLQFDRPVETVWSALPADMFDAIGQSIPSLTRIEPNPRAAGVGAIASLRALPGLDGVSIDLKALAAKGPLVLTFNRGDSCPCCGAQLHAFARRHSEFVALGASVVAITPAPMQNAAATSATIEIPFSIALDASGEFAREFGLAFSSPADLRPLYRQIGIDFVQWSDEIAYEPPISATFVIDSAGVVCGAFVENDFTKRVNLADVLSAVRAIA